MDPWITSLLAWLALPKFGLSTVFVVSFVSATLLPLGSEPVVFGLVKLNPALFWPAVLVGTAGNTLGGAVTWAMGWGSRELVAKYSQSRNYRWAQAWLGRIGPKACLLSWLPGVGDPLCAVAGWLRLPFWPCLLYMAIGKFLRYLLMTAALLWVFPSAAIQTTSGPHAITQPAKCTAGCGTVLLASAHAPGPCRSSPDRVTTSHH